MKPSRFTEEQIIGNDDEPWVEEKHCAPCITEIWDLRQGIPLGTFTEHREALFNQVAISPDLQAIAIRDPLDTKRVLLWDVALRKPGPILIGHQSEITSIAFSPNGRLVGTASWDRTGRAWDSKTGTQVSVLRGHGDHVNSIAFDQQGQRAITGSRDTNALLWPLTDPTTAELKAPPSPNVAVEFNGDGTLLAVSGGRAKKAETPFPLNFVTPSAGCEGKCVVRIWDVKTRQILFDFETKDVPQGMLRFHPTEKLLLTAGLGTSVYYSSSTRSGPLCRYCTVTAWNLVTGAKAYVLQLESGVISNLEFSPDGQLMAISTDAGPIFVFDAITGAKVTQLTGHSGAVKKITFHPSSRWLLSASWDQTVRLWDLRTAKTIRIYKGHRAKVGHIQFNADGTRFVSSSEDHTARLWDTESGRQIAEFAGHIQAVNQAVFFAEGESRVITAADDNSIIVWNSREGTPIHTLSGHVNSGPFSGVKRISMLVDNGLVSFGSDGAVRIWDLKRGVAADILTRPDRTFFDMALNPLQNQLALIRNDGEVQIRPFDRADALKQIDRLSALSIPVIGTELQKEYGPGATLNLLDLQQGDHAALIVRIRAASRSYGAALATKSALTVGALQRLADAGAVEAHVKIAEFLEARRDDRESLSRAFFHHRVAERLFRILDRNDEANFHAARRASLASILSRDALSEMWREAQRWPTYRAPRLRLQLEREITPDGYVD